MSADKRDTLYAGWKRAVELARDSGARAPA
jgi:hypothetical protein